MHICNYCNRVLKEDYEKCPGCGGSSFSNKSFIGDIVIKEPPKDGYLLDYSNIYRTKKRAILTIIITILINVVVLFTIFVFVLFTIVLGLFAIWAANSFLKQSKNDLKRIKKLATKGILYKSLDYEIVDTGSFVGNRHYKCIKVVYKNSNGVDIPLYSETKYDLLDNKKKYKTVDLLIDPDDFSNYFIDYEIY